MSLDDKEDVIALGKELQKFDNLARCTRDSNGSPT
jgi:hypothetical protein